MRSTKSILRAMTVYMPRHANAFCSRRCKPTIGHMIFKTLRISLVLLLLALATTISFADDAKKPATELPASITPTDYLVLPAVGQYGRLALQRDAIEAELVAGKWKPPTAGDVVKTADGKSATWSAAKADGDGALDTQKVRGGYALATFDSPAERVMMLEAAGHAMVYVNGEPHAGDTYTAGWFRLPVPVKPSKNTLLFHLSGDKLKARLTKPRADVYFADEDRTLPTALEGEIFAGGSAAVPIVNASTKWLENVAILCQEGNDRAIPLPLSPIPPLSVYKAAISLPRVEHPKKGTLPLKVRLIRTHETPADAPADDSDTIASTEVKLKVVGPDDVQVGTFRSEIDGSVQPFAFRPPAKAPSSDSDQKPKDDTNSSGSQKPGLILALHGAGATCEDYAAQFSSKAWASIYAPQGRRPYGFDWEAWSRADALEVLDNAKKSAGVDPRKIYLTGHSMGGHGAWHIGVTRPDLFAAIGPASGWISYWSYGGGMPSMETPTDIEALMLRGYSASDTLKLLTNLTNTGVYLLHDAADQTVPVAQARFMRTRLAAFHPNFVYFEQPPAAQDSSNERNECAGMMDFFRQQTAPTAAEQTYVDFTTANPAVSSSCYWVSIEAQQEQLSPSHVAIRQNPKARTFVGNTSNVARLAIDVTHLSDNQPIDVTLDGQSLNWLKPGDKSQKLWFERQGDQWSAAEEPEPQEKGPARYGTFNAVFDHRPLLVYGTIGNQEENDWALAKARYDAEIFYYRAGGSLEMLPDSRFDFNRDADRNVILYGNADTNSAWSQLLATSPVEVRRGHVRVGTRKETSDDLAVVAVRPRPGSDSAMVGIVAGTGPAGMRLTNRLRWFVSGIVYPDLMILEPKMLTEGTSGVRAWGYFGLDWRAETGDIAWRNPAL